MRKKKEGRVEEGRECSIYADESVLRDAKKDCQLQEEGRCNKRKNEDNIKPTHIRNQTVGVLLTVRQGARRSVSGRKRQTAGFVSWSLPLRSVQALPNTQTFLTINK